MFLLVIDLRRSRVTDWVSTAFESTTSGESALGGLPQVLKMSRLWTTTEEG